MADNIIPLGNITRLDYPTDRVLDECKGHCSVGVVIAGWDDDGQLCFASSIADGGDVLWLLERAKQELMEVG